MPRRPIGLFFIKAYVHISHLRDILGLLLGQGSEGSADERAFDPSLVKVNLGSREVTFIYP
jgi:hypothetical protein